METELGLFDRTELLVGGEIMETIKNTRVILFGVGGVGSWCAESLIRSGIGQLTIVDSDRVCITNVNRQLMATTKTIGQVKVDVLKERLLEINPAAKITAIQQIYEATSSDGFRLNSYDYIIDAIDSLENKAELIRRSTRTNATLFSSMGAALKIDPLKIRTGEFWKVQGCPLAAALRRKMKKGEKPAKKFICVFSEERLPNKGKEELPRKGTALQQNAGQNLTNTNPDDHDWNSLKAQINGTMAHTTAIFGFTLASLVIQDIYYRFE